MTPENWKALALAALPFVKISRSPDSTRSYGGRAMACDECDVINGGHADDCQAVAALNKVNAALAAVGMEPIVEDGFSYEEDDEEEEIEDDA